MASSIGGQTLLDEHHAEPTPSHAPERNPSWSRVAIAIAVAGLLLVGLCIRVGLRARQVGDGSEPVGAARQHEDDPLEVAWKRTVGQFQAMPEFRDLLARSPSPQEPVQLIRALATKGAARLPDDALLQRVSLMRAVVERADVVTCAAIFRNSPTVEQLHTAFLKLDPDALDAWIELTARSAMAELKQVEAPSVSETEVTDALAALVGGLPADEGERLSRVLDDTAQASDENACWAAKTLYGNVTRMGDPHGRVLARALARD